jgi:NAD(P)-dependent dehydrogenase (short-subunit alcohol dehydrogenase family)
MAQDEKYALITGSSRGIGRGIALALAESGVKVAIHFCQNETAARDTLAQVRQRGSDGFLVQADVTRPEQITQMFRKVRTDLGKLDIFVSNARPAVPAFFQPPLDITLAQWETAFDSQAKAFLIGVREALPLMSDGGRIFAITYAKGAARVGCNLGSAWVQRKRHSSHSCVISASLLRNVESR